ncbi:MAG: choice-of-anchor J domain-containing protein [Bacteroidales bacterium]|nr:choice-of-anchor J domain-containing protein [Bacteroidales bacterium]
MKKIFTLFIALFVMSFCAKAQVSFLNEDFEGATVPAGWTAIDADGDGYNWVSSTTVGTFNAHSGSACITSASYVNYVGALTPDNWLITPQLAVSAGDSVSFWYRGQDASYSAEVFGVYVSTTGTATTDFTSVYQGVSTSDYQRLAISLNAYAGQNIYVAIRHYNVTDMFWLNIDDFMFGSVPSAPTLASMPDTLDLGMTPVGMNADQSMTVTAYSLTNDITVTTAAPFSVSADGITFGTTATLTATTGTGSTTSAPLYVRYTPTAVGVSNGSMTIASTGVTSATVALVGNGIDCTVSTFPYNFSFDNAGMANCWSVVDANEDGSTFSMDPSAGYAYYTYNSSNAANDYLISPEFVLTGNEMASFDYWCSSATWPESFMVYAFGADTSVLVNTVNVTNTSTAPMTQYIGLSDLVGNYRIAIKCTSDADEYRLYVDNFSVVIASEIMTVDPDAVDFGTIKVATSSEASFSLDVVNASSDVTITTDAPYSLSLDGNSYSTSVTIPATTSLISTTVTVKYAPTTVGTHNGTVTIATTGTSETVTLTGTAVECNVINTFPFYETFDVNSSTRPCWEIVDANNDGRTIQFMAYDSENTGVAAYFYNSDNSAEDWLISPEITLPNDAHAGFEYAIASASYPEKFSVWVIPEGGSVSSAVNVSPTQAVSTTGLQTKSVDLSAYSNQTVKVAIKVESNADMYYIYFDNFQVTEGAGIEDVENNIVVYPNPASNMLNVTANSNIQSVEVLNMMGQIVMSQNANDTHTQVNVSSLANGVYMVKVNTENGVINQKFTVAR